MRCLKTRYLNTKCMRVALFSQNFTILFMNNFMQAMASLRVKESICTFHTLKKA
jgi:hypothetical protein